MEASSSSPAESICTCAEIVLRDETVSCFKLVVEKESILKCLLKCTSVHVQSSSFFRSEPWSRFETPVVNIVPGWGEESKVASQSGRVFFFLDRETDAACSFSFWFARCRARCEVPKISHCGPRHRKSHQCTLCRAPF